MAGKERSKAYPGYVSLYPIGIKKTSLEFINRRKCFIILTTGIRINMLLNGTYLLVGSFKQNKPAKVATALATCQAMVKKAQCCESNISL
ncbi:hypothetical protein [Mucilaginibacter sp.]